MRRTWMAGLPPAMILLALALPTSAPAQAPDVPPPPEGEGPFARRDPGPAPTPVPDLPASDRPPVPPALAPGELFAVPSPAPPGPQTDPALEAATLTSLGLEKVIASDDAGAIDDFTKAIKLDPALAAAYRYRGEARLRACRFVLAMEDLDRAVRLAPDDADILAARRKVRERIDAPEVDEAVNLANLWLMREGFRPSKAPSVEKDRDDTLKLPKLGFSSGRPAEPESANTSTPKAAAAPPERAMNEVEYARAERAKISPAWAAVSRYVERREPNDPEGARASLEMARVLDPTILPRVTAELACESGLRAMDSGDTATALEALARAIRYDPAQVIARRARAKLEFDRGHVDEALADLDAAVRIEPGNPLSYAERGVASAERGDLDAAIADYDTALRLDPAYSVALRVRAIAFQKRGDLDRAEADASAVVRLAPEVSASHWRRGEIRQARADYSGAADDYSAALRLEPFSAALFAWRAFCRERSGDAAGAIADAEDALGLDSAIAPAYYVRALGRHARGDHAGALADAEQAYRLEPTEIEYLLTRAFILATSCDGRVRDPQKALDLAVRARRLAGDGPAEHKALHTLALADAAVGDYRSAFLCQLRAIRRDWPKVVLPDELVRLPGYLLHRQAVVCAHAFASPPKGLTLGHQFNTHGVVWSATLSGVGRLRLVRCHGCSWLFPVLEIEPSP